MFSYISMSTITIMLFITVAAILIVMILQKLINGTASTSYGSARKATTRDLKRAGFKHVRNPFVYVGAWKSWGNKTYLKHSGSEHILLMAPTRTGKGVSLIIPTALDWTDSMVVTDIKGELWSLTAAYRKSIGHNVIKFEPSSSSNTGFFNPLNELSLDSSDLIKDVQNIANILIKDDTKPTGDHWINSARNLFTGLVIYCLEVAKQENREAVLKDVFDLLNNPEEPIKVLFAKMRDDSEDYDVRQTGAEMLNKPDNEAGSIISTLTQILSIFRDRTLSNNLSKSSFRLEDITNSAAPTSLYIVIPPSDLKRLSPIFQLLIEMIIRHKTKSLELKDGIMKNASKYKLLFLLDEFPSLGKIPIIESSLSYLSGYGIRCFFVTQDLKQLRNEEYGYGRNENITSNCHIQIAFTPNNIETAEYLSRMTGQTTVRRKYKSTSNNVLSLGFGNYTRGMQEHQRLLFTEDEVLRLKSAKKKFDKILKGGEMLIFVGGCPVIKSIQPLYFQDKKFLAKTKIKMKDNPISKNVLVNVK